MAAAKRPRHAERLFGVDCAAHGATCNPSSEDDQGWDWFVEFPQAERKELPPDLHAPPHKTLVQIKSGTGKPLVRVKLTNALRFAKDPIPCFFVFYRYADKGNSPPEVYLLHCWTEFIEIALRRARLAHAEGIEKLHGIEIRIPLRPEHRIAANVAATIRDQIDSIGADYEAKKKQFGQTVGFGEDALVGSISFADDVTAEDISDMEIGLKEHVSVSKFQMRSNRFGIPAREPDVDADSGFVTIRSEGTACDIIARTRAPKRQVRFEGKYFAAGPPLPEKNWQIRVVWGVGEVRWRAKQESATFTFSWDTSDGVPLSDLHSIVRLGAMLERGNVDVEIQRNGKRIVGRDLDFPKAALGRGWRKIDDFLTPFIGGADRVEKLFAVSDFAGQLDKISDYLAYMSPGDLTVNADLYDGRDLEVIDGTLVYGAGVELRSGLFWSFATRRMRTSETSGRALKVVFGPPENRQDEVYEGTLADNAERLQGELDELAAQMTRPNELIVSVPNILMMPKESGTRIVRRLPAIDPLVDASLPASASQGRAGGAPRSGRPKAGP